MLSSLESHHGELERAGLTVLAVAQGEPKHNERYCGSLAPNITCLSDSTTDSYHTWGLQQGKLGELLNVGVIMGGVRAASKGHVGGPVIGDARMMPGTFIVDGAGIVRYAFYATHAADHPPIADLLHAASLLGSASN
ncbi:MAG: redoxin domain-containing protein [Pleurocapsa minor GSE-CHR-MK-17-07R]|jgi:peroxiredoxin|nr:redoxin domain-containing protein [Pleurocapsa minor GSE-CHR-MK 17-07R]